MKKQFAVILVLVLLGTLAVGYCEGNQIKLSFPGAFITEKSTTLEANKYTIRIDEHVFVPNDLVTCVDRITDALEEVTGWSFEGNPEYASEKAYAHINRSESDNEYTLAYAEPSGIELSAGDLLEKFALIHESTHLLQYRQSGYNYCTWAMDGISTYTTHKVNALLLERYPDMAEMLLCAGQDEGNYGIYDFETLYACSMEYWVDNVFEGCGNNNYGIGYCLMRFLDEQYGDYTRWVILQEEKEPCWQNWDQSCPDARKQIEVFQNAYGEDDFDRFYEWLRQNEARFSGSYTEAADRTATRQIDCLPQFYYEDARYECHMLTFVPIRYKDLLIGLADGKLYLSAYKGRSVDHLSLSVDDGLTLCLYDADGVEIGTVTAKDGEPIDVTNAAAIRLVGEGTLSRFEITGF